MQITLQCTGNPHDPINDPSEDGCQETFIVDIEYTGPICEPCPVCGRLCYAEPE